MHRIRRTGHICAPVLVGREREHEEMSGLLGSARAGRGRAAFLVGQPGIGKSRLAKAIAVTAAESGMCALWGRASDIETTTAFRPLTEALLGLARDGVISPDDLGPYRDILARLIPDWRRRNRSDPDGSLVVLAEGVLRLLSVAAGKCGCLLVIEDLHHADVGTLAVVEYLVDNLADQPVLLLCTLRGGFAPLTPLIDRAERLDHAIRLNLSGLTERDVAVMTAHCLASDPGSLAPALVKEVWQCGGGNPFLTEELLRTWVNDGTFICGSSGWALRIAPGAEPPSPLVRDIARRTEGLGRQSLELLRAAALLGDRFPVPLLGRMAGIDDAALADFCSGAVSAGLVVKEPDVPDWYRFRHPRIGNAVRRKIPPAEGKTLAGRLADAVNQEYPGLPGEWCQEVAHLRARAGQLRTAHGLLVRAAAGARQRCLPEAAATLLEQAYELAAAEPAPPDVRADILILLLAALGEVGHVDRALGFESVIDELASATTPATQAALHIAMARVARLAGQTGRGRHHVRAARDVLGPQAPDDCLAPVNAMDAALMLDSGLSEQMEDAESLANQAIAAAQRYQLPSVVCDAGIVLGTVRASRNLDEAVTCWQRVLALAEVHRLPTVRMEALVQIGAGAWLATGEIDPLCRAREEAIAAGAALAIRITDATLAIDAALRCQYHRLAEIAERATENTAGTDLGDFAGMLTIAQAIAAASRGRRQEMDALLTSHSMRRDDQACPDRLSPLVGTAKAFCALVEEDIGGARRELDVVAVADGKVPAVHHLGGRYGLSLLLDVLAGTAGWERYRVVADSTPGRLRWNRQFLALTRAVLLGRDGHRIEAAQAVEEAADLAQIYPMAWCLGLRLVAVAAHEHGWGDPVRWLREAEDRSATGGVSALARTCRTLQRSMGAPVRQRRQGSERVPWRLRSLGVTSREYEVLELLASSCTNREIAVKLYLSPRTIDRHVSNLLAKTGMSDRMSLCEHYLEHQTAPTGIDLS